MNSTRTNKQVKITSKGCSGEHNHSAALPNKPKERLDEDIPIVTTVAQLNELATSHPLHFLQWLAYRGFVLLPIKPAISTEDLTPYVSLKEGGSKDHKQVARWFHQYKGCWWALVTGEKSGITIIDPDRHNGQDGFKTLEKRGIALTATMRQRTPNNGLHLGYNYNSLVPTKNGVDVGVDTRNDNGFILIAPTIKNGKRYEWETFPFDRNELTDIPDAFIKTYFSRQLKNARKRSNKQQLQLLDTPPCVKHLITSGVPSGVNYNAANMILATYAKDQHLTQTAALQLALQMAQHTTQEHETNKKTTRDKQHNFESAYAAVLNDEKYEFSCGNVRKYEPLKKVCQKSDCDLKEFYPRFSHPFFVLELLERYGGRIRYCPQLGWLWWDGKRWKLDSKERVKKGLIKVINRLKNGKKPIDEKDKEVVQLANDRRVKAYKIVKEHEDYNKKLYKEIRSALNNYNLEAVLTLANAFESIVVQFDQLDQHSFLLNCQNGTLNLKTGQLQPFNKEDYLTKICKVNYRKGAYSKLFADYLKQRLPNLEVREFLQKYLGYCLTAETSEELMAFLYGDSRSGKSTLITSFYLLLGDYSGVISRNLLMKGHDDKKLQILASALGKRFLMCDETKENDVFDEAFIKAIISAEPQLARYLYQELFTYLPTWKLAVIGNVFPKVHDSTEASWRRLGIIPFEMPLSEDEVNPDVKKQFKTNAEVQEAILSYTVEGCFKWQHEGIKAPNKVREEKVQQKIENNPIFDFALRRLQFIKEIERTETEIKYALVDSDTSFADIYRDYELEHQQHAKGRYKVPKQPFANYLKALGFTKVTASAKRTPYYEHVILTDITLDIETTATALSIFRNCLVKNESIKNIISLEKSLLLLQSSPNKKEDEIEEKQEKERQKDPLEKQGNNKKPEKLEIERKNISKIPEKLNYFLVNEGNCKEILQELTTANIIGLDTETTGLNPLIDSIRLIQCATNDTAYIFDLFNCPSSVQETLRTVLTSPIQKVGHNLKFDIEFLKRAGYDVTGPFFDTFLACKLLYSRDNGALNSLTKKYLSITLDKEFQKVDWKGAITTPMYYYAAQDSLVLLPLYDKLVSQLEESNLTATARLEFDLLPVVVDMELTGIQIDVDKWKCIIEDTKRQLQGAKDDLKLAFKDLNLNLGSPQQIKLAFKQFGINTKSVDQKVLLKYISDFPVIQKYLRYKELSKLTSSFTKTFLDKVINSRLHPQYHQLGTETGRFSCTNPNLQQVPKNEIRTCFIACPGKKIIQADYSQIELRILAEVTKDKRLVAAFQDNEDIHSITAAAVLHKPLSDVTKEERQQAKALNFGLMYGAGAETFRQSALRYGVNLKELEAIKLRDEFFSVYPTVRQWQRTQGNKVETCTLGGRLRRWQRKDGPPGYTELLNSGIQGTGADILKRALINLYQNVNGTAKIIGTIHDEILLEVDEQEAEALKNKVERIMKRAGEYYLKTVPVEVDISICDTWGG